MLRSAILALALASTITAHTAAWAPGMYCRGGADPAVDDQNTNLAVNPLYNLKKEDWWFQHHRGCDAVPPKAGEFLEIPANGEFTVELAHNRAFTTLSYEGKMVTDWPDGKDHPEDWNGFNTDGTVAVCLKDDGALHTYNESSAGGTAFAISYNSDMKDVTMENLVVFTTLDHTPWKRVATYQVPDLPECPPEGCMCAWLWIPNGCGEANMYMQGFKCNVTGATSTTPLAEAQVPVYCENDQSKCVKGAKQMLAWHQMTGNNIETEQWVTPNYNKKCGWANGAQTDIFEGSSAPTSTASANSTTTPTPSSIPPIPFSTATPTLTTDAVSTTVPTYSDHFSTTLATVVSPSVVYSDYFSTTLVSVVSSTSVVVKDETSTTSTSITSTSTTFTSTTSTSASPSASTSTSITSTSIIATAAPASATPCTTHKRRHRASGRPHWRV